MIEDNDAGTITIDANEAAASEPDVDGQFTVTLSAASSTDTTVNYSVSGEAVAGQDYESLSGSVLILAGQTMATIDITVINDNTLEPLENVTLALTTAIGDSEFTVDTNPATVTIADEDVSTASVTATSEVQEGEGGGQFTFNLTNPSSTDTTIAFTVGGSANTGTIGNQDFTQLSPLQVTIPAGQTSLTIDIAILDDQIVEDAETIIVTLGEVIAGDDGISIDSAVATMTIVDSDTAVVSVMGTTDASEPDTEGLFTVSMTQASDTDTTVAYSVGGTATAGGDYETLSGTATILAGKFTTTIPVSVLDDTVLEGTETVAVTLGAVTGDIDITSDSSTATINLADDEVLVASITAGANATDGMTDATNGSFTVTLVGGTSETDTTLTLAVSGGSALEGTDFNIPLDVTIAAGETSATVVVSVTNDGEVELDETVTVALSGQSIGNGVTVDPAEATISIIDQDVAEVSVTASDPDASEIGPQSGEITVSLSAPSSTDTIVTLTPFGTDDNDDLGQPLPTVVTIPAGTTAVVVAVDPVTDSLIEGSETVMLIGSIAAPGSDANPDITVSFVDTATVTITDGDTGFLTVEAIADGSEEASTPGQFRISLSTPSATDTNVTVLVGGTASRDNDYTIANVVVIPANSESVVFDVATIDDDIVELAETVTLTVTESSNVRITPDPDNDSDVISIVDNDVAVARIRLVSDGKETVNGDDPVNGQFVVELVDPVTLEPVTASTATSISLVTTGSATIGTDVTGVPDSIIIAAGTSETAITVVVLDDQLLEGSETVIVGLDSLAADANPSISIPESQDSATVQVIDNENSASVSFVEQSLTVNEGDETVSFQLQVDQAVANGFEVEYQLTDGTAVRPGDFGSTSASGTVTFIGGDADEVVTVTIPIQEDAIVEDNELFTIVLGNVNEATAPDGSVTSNGIATVVIQDNDDATATISATNAAEPDGDGSFIVSLDAASSTDTVINYTVTGTAVAGTGEAGEDYQALSGVVTILAGQTAATIDVSIFDDDVLEQTESITVTLDSEISSGDLDITTDTTPATLLIADDDTGVVSVEATISAASEPGDDGQFTITLSEIASTDTTINVNVSGTAVSGEDYEIITTVITIEAGQNSATIPVTVLNDVLNENVETVTMEIDSIIGDESYSIGDSNSATVSIADDEALTISIHSGIDAVEDATDGTFVLNLVGGVNSTDTVVELLITGGDADVGDDFTIPATATIPAGDSSVTIDVLVLADTLVESTETVTVALGNQTSGIEVAVDSTAATISISDNDSATVSITALDPSASEIGPDAGEFLVELSGPASTDTTVTLTPSGSGFLER